MVKDNYKKLALNYDLLRPKEEIFEQSSFFKKIIKRYNVRSALDCACGSGWHLYMLNGLDVNCYGSDLSVEMLDKSKENLEALPIPLKQGDFRYLEETWDKCFDMIICMTTSFPHNRSFEDALRCLESMKARLNENGIIIIDNGFSDAFLNEKPKFVPAKIGEDQAFYFFLEYPKKEHILFNILNVIKTPTGFDHVFETMDYLALSKERYSSLFEKTEYKNVDYFGGFDLSVYSETVSKRLIMVAQK
jgi:glycine/sarcosine N-methyltransferase